MGKHRPYGLYGGKSGAGSINILKHTDGQEEVLPTMVSTKIKKDESIYHRMAAGGGWGKPFNRSISAVLDDVRYGKVSVAAARDEYGVVVDEINLMLDEQATAKLRRQIKRKADL